MNKIYKCISLLPIAILLLASSYAQPTTSVSGFVLKDNDEPVEGAFINCSTCTPNDVFTDQNGFYSFSDLELGTSLTVEKQGSPAEGVTVLDLIKLRQVILFPDSFPITRQIAGDVNNSGATSTFDLVKFPQLIILQEEVNPSWIYDPYQFEVEDTSEPITDANFLAIKKGDVIFESEVPKVSASPKFIINSGTINNNSVDIHIKVESFEDIVGFQYGLKWDPTVLSFNSIEGVAANEFSFSDSNQYTEGELLLFWLQSGTGFDGITLSDGSTIFTLNFSILNDQNPLVPFEFDFSTIPGQVVLTECRLAEPVWENGEVQVGTVNLEDDGVSLSLFPNPVSKGTQTFLEVETLNAQDLQIKVLDASSKAVVDTQGSFPIGETTIPLFIPEEAGVYMIEVSNSKGINQTLKLMVF